MADPKVAQFMQLTGASDDMASAALASSNGDLDAAIASHFEQGDTSAAPTSAAPVAAAPALPTEGTSELVGSILSAASAEGGPSSTPFAGRGQALGSSLAAEGDGGESDASVAPSAAAMMADRTNSKKVRVIFWSDGFTIEDVTAEEEAAAAAEAAAKAAPRRTGVSTLGDTRTNVPPMPKIPELRKYEDNKEFMEDLKAGVPPVEFRELDLSSGTPRPRPVDIMLGDMRPNPYPAEAVRRQAAMAMGQPPPPTRAPQHVVAFSGTGQTLGGQSASTPADGGTSSSAAEPIVAGGAWPSAECAPPSVDAAAPTTVIQVRLPGGPQRFTLNRTHTVADLKSLVEQRLAEAGEAPRPYILSSGFPPKPLADDSATLEAAGVLNAAVTHRWG